MKNFQMFMNDSPSPMLILNMNGQIMVSNERAQIWPNVKVNGYVGDICKPEYKNIIEQMFQRLQESNELHEKLITKRCRLHIDATKFHYNKQQYFFVILRDITAEYRKEQQAYELTTRDMLTGLHNRYYCEKHINTQIQLLKASQLVAFILINLDNVRQVSDRYGHMLGDAYLEHVGAILSALNYGKNLVARIRENEFALYFHNVAYEDVVFELIEELRYLFDVNSFRKNNSTITVQFSAGYAIGNQHSNFALLYQRASEQLYTYEYENLKNKQD